MFDNPYISAIEEINTEFDRKKRLEKVLDEELPNMTRDMQYHRFYSYLQTLHPSNSDFDLYYSLGKEISNIVNCSSSIPNVIHLLSTFTDIMTRKEATRLIGKSISHNNWCRARQHRAIHGSGMPNLEKKVTKHRRRIEEKTIQDFVEWLNANDFLQNLAFGEKIIKYSDGFHIAIESIKRTKSLASIIKTYYRDFLDVNIENATNDLGIIYKNEINKDKERNEFSDISSEDSTSDEDSVDHSSDDGCEVSELK